MPKYNTIEQKYRAAEINCKSNGLS